MTKDKQEMLKEISNNLRKKKYVISGRHGIYIRTNVYLKRSNIFKCIFTEEFLYVLLDVKFKFWKITIVKE